MMFFKAKQRAKKKNIEFSITIDDIVVPEKCPYLGTLLEWKLGVRAKKNSPSLDRIDNSKGYTKDNIEVISWQANTMKSNATREELKQFAEVILRKIDNVS